MCELALGVLIVVVLFGAPFLDNMFSAAVWILAAIIAGLLVGAVIWLAADYTAEFCVVALGAWCLWLYVTRAE